MKRKASLTVIFITVFIDLMGFGIIMPILPNYASNSLGISDTGIGILVAVFSLMQFVFNPVIGKISDRIGRRPIILASLALTGISYLLFSAADTFILIFIARMLAGLGGSNIGTAQAYIADITSKKERAQGMGLVGAAFGMGFAFGPIIGGYLAEFGYEMAGYGSAAMSFIALIFAVFLLPESNINRSADEKFKFKLFDFKSLFKVLKSPATGPVIALLTVAIFSVANIYGTFALLGNRQYGFTDQEIGYLYSIMGGVAIVIQGFLIKHLTKIFSDRILFISSIIFLMIGLAFIPYAAGMKSMIVIITVLMIGSSIIQPVSFGMISKSATASEQGEVLGVNQSMAALARVLGPVWGGMAYESFGFEYPFLTGAFFTFITLIFSFKYLLRNNSQNV